MGSKRMQIGRTRVELPALGSWEAVDAALLEIGEIDVSLASIEGVMNTAIQEAKAAAAEEAGPAMERRKVLVRDVQAFCDARKADFGARKSRELNHGRVGWRESSSLRVLDTDVTIRRIQEAGRKELLTVKVSVNKESMQGLPTPDLDALGVKRETKDAFFLEPDLERVKAAPAATAG
jgi:phage host-nuclease inhibitor protein Gam